MAIWSRTNAMPVAGDVSDDILKLVSISFVRFFIVLTAQVEYLSGSPRSSSHPLIEQARGPAITCEA